jgi:hypothetical protein
MQTKIKTTVYAKQLRAKLKELEAKRKKDLADYKTNFETWRVRLVEWLRTNGVKRVDVITMTEVKNHTNKYHRSVRFDTSAFFAGAPEPPTYPSDKQIRDIKALLRHLGITGQQTINVTTEDVARHLGDGEKYEED